MLRWGLVDCALEVDVPVAACATLRDYDALARRRDVGHEETGLGVRGERAARHVNHKVLPAPTEAAPAGAGHTILRE